MIILIILILVKGRDAYDINGVNEEVIVKGIANETRFGRKVVKLKWYQVVY